MAKLKAVPGASGGVDDVLNRMQDDINKHFGDGTASRLTESTTLSRVDHWVSTRSMVVDSVLRGGRTPGSSLVPFGRQMEISGPENSGKTTLCAQIAAETQAKGGLVVVTDTEERIDEPYWMKLGVDTSRILHIGSQSLRDVFNKQYKALEIARAHAGDRLVLLLWDSLGATQGTDIELDDKIDPMEQAEKFGMRRAKIISDGMELINAVVGKTRACYLYTNHEYTKIGVSYGSPRETRGGNKPKYFATVRLQLTPVAKVKEADSASNQEQVIGQRVRVKALKNQMAGVLMEREAVVMAHKGFVDAYTVFETGIKLGVIDRAGSWSTWTSPKGEVIRFQGYTGFEEKVLPHAEYGDLYNQVQNML